MSRENPDYQDQCFWCKKENGFIVVNWNKKRLCSPACVQEYAEHLERVAQAEREQSAEEVSHAVQRFATVRQALGE